MSTLFRRGAQLIVFALVLASVGGSTLAQSTESFGWQRYQAEGFSVLLPEHPNTMLIAAPQRMNERRPPARLFTAYKDQVVYIVLVFDNPSHYYPLSRFIADTRDYNLNARAEKFTRDISGTGFTGKEYSFGNNDQFRGIIRFHVAPHRVYLLQAIGEDVSKPEVNRFLDSFALGSDDSNNISYENPLQPEPATIGPPAKPEIFPGNRVTTKARVLIRPEPMYTEAARQARVTGTVVIRAVFTSTGHIRYLTVRSGLPQGLTEKAMEAAKNLKFIPAMKDGQYVSMYIQLEYNFNLY